MVPQTNIFINEMCACKCFNVNKGLTKRNKKSFEVEGFKGAKSLHIIESVFTDLYDTVFIWNCKYLEAQQPITNNT